MNINKKGTLYNNIYMLKLIFRISPMRVILEFVFQLIGFAEWTFFTVVFMKYLFGAEEIQRSFEDIALFLIIVTAVMMLLSISESWFYNVYSVRMDNKIYFEMNRMLFEKAASVDISCYEDADFYDTYTKATSEANSRAMSVLRNVCTLIGSICSSAYVIYTIFSINIIAGFFTFLPVTGNLIFGHIINKAAYQKDMDNVPYNRRINYVNRIIYLSQYAKEIRLTNVFRILKNTYNKAYDGINGNTDKYFKKLFTLDSISHILCFPLVFEGLWLYAAYSAMVTKTILIGDFVILSSAIVSTTWMLIDMSNSLIECYKNSNYINNLHAFMNYTPKIDESSDGIHIADTDNIVLTLNGVSFKYPGQSEYSLRDINITVKSGEKIALVGHNGAGKTTLVKLIMRLYDPTDGQIFLNGTDIREYNLKEYRKIIGTVFQDFQIFSMSVSENVLMNSVIGESDNERAVNALRQSGAYDKVMSLGQKEKSILTREFDDNGEILSGGEYQKIAVARAFAKENQIIILDEPSSALDPVAEYQMYETIMKLYSEEKNKRKIAFIISHRLSSATTADYIYMFENGRIIEKGTHASLMKNSGGVYRDMFTRQAESYLTEVFQIS